MAVDPPALFPIQIHPDAGHGRSPIAETGLARDTCGGCRTGSGRCRVHCHRIQRRVRPCCQGGAPLAGDSRFNNLSRLNSFKGTRPGLLACRRSRLGGGGR